MDSVKREEDFLFRWPGDEYVDFIGMDCYHGLNPATFSSNLKTISELSKKKKKPCGVTETGVEGFTDKDYWSTFFSSDLPDMYQMPENVEVK